ncbi:MAG: amidohydrolase family protein [Verrucomicrobia bacterium]|nr:amidohydrolase family protein [Verrucomicrobiota bacterium]
MIVRARVVLPVARPPIEDGAVVVHNGCLAFVGRWTECPREARARVTDLGEVTLLPGLVNAHCHLDYTDMAGQIAPTASFTDWIKSITTLKAQWGYSEFARSWLNGARMLAKSGVTTVADIEAVPELLPEVWTATPLRVISFLEMTGVKSRRAPRQILTEAVRRIDALAPGRGALGLSPHAPYSTTPELLRLSAEIARQRRWRLTTHVAESAQEYEMFTAGRGEMFDWLRRNARDMSDCGRGSPVQHLERQGFLGDNLLAVHVNRLAPGDATLLGRRGVHIAHCPRSHEYFRHPAFPLTELTAAGVNVCLGTDSLVTVRQGRGQRVALDLLAEMRTLAAREPGLAPETILRMATVNGARALGLERRVGELSVGAWADLIAVPAPRHVPSGVEAAVLEAGPVMASMIDGQWVFGSELERQGTVPEASLRPPAA